MALATSVPAENLVVNGSFEEPDIPTGSFDATFLTIPGWGASDGTIEIQDSPSVAAIGPAFDGDQHVELDSLSNSIVYTVVPTVASQSYILEFAYSPRAGHPATTNGMDVFWDGVFLASRAESGIGLNTTNWSVSSFEVTASVDTTELWFAATGTSDTYGGLLDAVSVTVVPPGDLNGDAQINALDIDLLSEAVRNSSADLTFDVSRDGKVDSEDRRVWVEDLFGTLFGDASLNKEVDFIDFTSLSFHFSRTGGWAEGDFDGNGTIQFPDFLILSSNFGQSGGVAAIPEPSTSLLAALGILGLLGLRCRRREEDALRSAFSPRGSTRTVGHTNAIATSTHDAGHVP